MKARKAVDRVDSKLLKKQIATLNHVSKTGHVIKPAEEDHLHGLLNLLEAIYDEIEPPSGFINTWE